MVRARGLQEFSIVLFREDKVLLKISTVLSMETPDDMSIHAGNQVDSVGEAHRNQVISVVVLIDRVDMHVIPTWRTLYHRARIVMNSLRQGNLIVRFPLKIHLSSVQIDLHKAARLQPGLFLRTTEFRQGNFLGEIDRRQGSLSVLENVELVNVKDTEILPQRDLSGDLVILIQNHSISAFGIVECVLQDQRDVGFIINTIDDLEIEDIAVVEHGRSGPDEVLSEKGLSQCMIEMVHFTLDDIPHPDHKYAGRPDTARTDWSAHPVRCVNTARQTSSPAQHDCDPGR